MEVGVGGGLGVVESPVSVVWVGELRLGPADVKDCQAVCFRAESRFRFGSSAGGVLRP